MFNARDNGQQTKRGREEGPSKKSRDVHVGYVCRWGVKHKRVKRRRRDVPRMSYREKGVGGKRQKAVGAENG